MGISKKTYFGKKIFVALYATILFCAVTRNGFAQEKSKRIETINGKKYALHKVEKGQTLYGIAKLYEVDKNDIILENPDIINGLSIDKDIRIPISATAPKTVATTSKQTKYKEHTVEKGQTLYAISKKYNCKVDDIIAINPDLQADPALRLGQVLFIPSSQKEKEEQQLTMYTKPKNDGVVKTETIITIPEKQQEEDQITLTAIEEKKVINTDEGLNVALLLPLFLNTLNDTVEEHKTGFISNKAQIGLEFYQGFMIAVDSLKKQCLKTNIYVYDVENDSVKTANVLNKPEFKSIHAIVGPFYTSTALMAADFAKDNSIAFVSPLSPNNKVLLNNPKAIKLVAAQSSQYEAIADYIAGAYKDENLLSLYYDNTKQLATLTKFNNYLKNKINNKDSIKTISYKNGGLKTLEASLSETKTNVIVVTITEQAIVTELINKLRVLSKKYKFVIIGAENWANFDNLEFETLQELQVIFPSSFFIEYTDPSTKKFMADFKAKYKTEPTKYAFVGFDVAYFVFSEWLKSNSFSYDHKAMKGLQTDFLFEQVGKENGSENKKVHLLKYQDFKLVKAH